VKPGESVGVFGCGPIGLLLISLLEAAGAAAIIATDPLPHRTAAADRIGAVALTTDGIGGPGEWEAASRGREVDVAFEAAGTDEALDAAIQSVKPGGRIVVLGIPDRDRTSFRASVARRKGLTMLISRRSKPIYERVIRLMESHGMDLTWLITHRFPLNRADEAFEVLQARSGLKVMVDPATHEVAL
jgi:L-iditol 2-dehydrogenase